MKIGITVASGFIGKRLVKKLEEDGFEVFKFVRRDVQNENEIFWSPSKQEIDIEKFQTLDALPPVFGLDLQVIAHHLFFSLHLVCLFQNQLSSTSPFSYKLIDMG